MVRTLHLLYCVLASAPFAQAQFRTTLSPKTTEAFEAYRKNVESQITHNPRYPQLEAGAARVEPNRDDGTTSVSDGIVHDWVGAKFVPDATVAQVVAVLQNYDAYKTIYAPDVVDSRVLSRTGNRFHAYLKIVKRNVLTAILNTEYDVEYLDLGNRGWAVHSRSRRIAEMDNDKERPPGTGYGFLWRMNAYWLLQPRGNGVYIECRSVSLSRDIPMGLGFAIKPFIRKLPEDSLRSTIEATAKALAK